MGSISQCFEPKTAILLEKWAAFRPAPNLKIQRRLAYNKPWKNWEALPPFAKPNQCRSHTWIMIWKKAAFCPPEPLNSKFALLQLFSWEKIVQHFAQFWNSKFKIALLQPFSCENWAAFCPALSPCFWKSHCCKIFLDKTWAAFRPALSPELQRPHCHNKCYWRKIGQQFALLWAPTSKNRIAAKIFVGKHSGTIWPFSESENSKFASLKIFLGKDQAAVWAPKLKVRMVDMFLGKRTGQHFASFWAPKLKKKNRMAEEWILEKMGSISPCSESEDSKFASQQKFLGNIKKHAEAQNWKLSWQK